MGYARIIITDELFRELIPLPETARVIGSLHNEQVGTVEVLVSDPGLPELVHGEKPRIAHPTIQHNVPREFVDWGLR